MCVCVCGNVVSGKRRGCVYSMCGSWELCSVYARSVDAVIAERAATIYENDEFLTSTAYSTYNFSK
jgi:hypothetical protein